MRTVEIDPAVWTIEEFAALVGISRSTAYKLCRSVDGAPPAVPTVRLGRTRKVSKAWVAGLLDGRYTLDGEPSGACAPVATSALA